MNIKLDNVMMKNSDLKMVKCINNNIKLILRPNIGYRVEKLN